MRRPFSVQSLLALGILWITMASLSAALGASLRGLTQAVFFPIAAFGVTLAWFLAFGAWKTWKAWTFLLVTGLLFVFIHNAKLEAPLLNLVKSLPGFEFQLVRWVIDGTPLDVTFLVEMLKTIEANSTPLGRNIWIWTQMLAQGNLPASLASRKMLWSIVVLLLSAWAGWTLIKKRQAFLALAPALILTAYVLDYSGKSPIPMLVELLSLLGMLGLAEAERRMAASPRSFSKSGEFANTLSTVFALALVITFSAGIMPSISVAEISERIEARSREKQNRDWAEAIGLRAAPGSKAYSAPGLPRQHLIGLDPSISQNVVLTIQTGELPPMSEERLQAPPPRHYWRGLTYDVYTGQGWATTLVESDKYASNQRLFDRIPAGYRIVHQKVIKSPRLKNRVYWTGSLLSVNTPYQAAWRVPPESAAQTADPFHNTDLLSALASVEEYQAASLIPNVTVDQLRSSRLIYPPWIQEHYLGLPSTVPTRVLQLAQDLTAGRANPYERARAIESYLRALPYTLDLSPPPAGRDVADYFLFDLQRGYCDYYATAMVVLARASGLPARLVTGYASGTYYATEAMYLIREADAHSWVEIYFASIGWIEFEPSGNRPQIDRSVGSSVAAQPLPPIPAQSASTPAPSSAFSYLTSNWPPLLVLILALLALVWQVSTLVRRERPEELVYRIYQQIYRGSRKLSPPASLHETPSAFAGRLHERIGVIRRDGFSGRLFAPAQKELALLTDLYLQALYSPRPLTAQEGKMALRTWKRFYWRLLLARWVH